MKKLIFAIFLLMPILAHAACNCDEDDEDDESYRQYEYIGFKKGDSRPEGVMAGELGEEYAFYYGKRVSALFGYEWEYAQVGKYSPGALPNTTVITALSASGFHYYDMSDSFTLWGKLGAAYAETKNADNRWTSVDLVAGVGFDYALNKNIRFRAGYDVNRVSLPDKTNDISSYLGLWAKL